MNVCENIFIYMMFKSNTYIISQSRPRVVFVAHIYRCIIPVWPSDNSRYVCINFQMNWYCFDMFSRMISEICCSLMCLVLMATNLM